MLLRREIPVFWGITNHLEVGPLLHIQWPVLESLKSLGDIFFRVHTEVACENLVSKASKPHGYLLRSTHPARRMP